LEGKGRALLKTKTEKGKGRGRKRVGKNEQKVRKRPQTGNFRGQDPGTKKQDNAKAKPGTKRGSIPR